jgi:cysteine desulfurase family protein (TIGR01976 family)
VRLWKARWPEGTLHVEDLAEMLSPRTRLVAMCAAANSTGTLTPVAEAARLTREAGGWTLVDAVHSAPHHLPDVRAWGVDFALMSTYKVFGPHLGVLWARQDLVADLPAEKLSFVADGDITKFEAGTAQHELLAGWLGTLSYLAELGGASAPAQAPTRGALVRAFERIEAAEAPVARALVEGLRDLAGVTLHGRQDMPGRVGTACFSVAGHRPRAVAEHLASRGVAVAAGHYYSVLPMTALGLMPDGAVRASIAHYTTTDEVGRLLDALRELPYSGA